MNNEYKAIAERLAKAEYDMAVHLLNTSKHKLDLDEAKALLGRSTQRHYAPGINAKGVMLYTGFGGVDKDIAGAHDYFRLACYQNLPAAQNNLAVALLNRNDVRPNYSTAHFLLERAAAAGNMAARTNLSIVYKFGLGVEKDDAEAAEWGDGLTYDTSEKFSDNLAIEAPTNKEN